jgi:hypothetical protein
MATAVQYRSRIDRLVSVAEAVERDSRAHLPLDGTLEVLDTILERCASEGAEGNAAASNAIRRMRRIVDQLRRDVRSGHVRSISGLAAESHRFAREVGAANANAA